MELKRYLKERKELIDRVILDYLPPNPPFGLSLYEAVKYSLAVGGKRLRPILCMAGCEITGNDYRLAIPIAVALEMIHTYSLVHDDLPAMDNDEIRRGYPTTWKRFGEATGVLAGDALLNRAFEVISEWDFDSERKIKVISEIGKASGMMGMVLGQQCDMEAEDRKDVSLEELKFIHKYKTGALITASIVSGGIIGGGDANTLSVLRRYGELIGYAFQIIDDVLDVIGDEKKLGKKVGSDIENGKVTFVTFFGVEGAKDEAKKVINEAKVFLKEFNENKRVPLEYLADFIVNREF